jgi:quinohemoprotein ethanol dehydrogenase
VVSKTGWVYILDRTNGQPLIGIDEKKVAQLKGAPAKYANTSKTQPYPVGDAFVNQCSSPKIWSAPDPDGHPFTTGCIFTPYAATAHGSFIASAPSAEGGVDWPPSSFSPQTNDIYLCVRNSVGTSIGAIPVNQIQIVPGKLSLGVNFGAGPKKYPDTGSVVAMDVTTNKLVWTTKWPQPCFNGVMTTASGLVFVGQNAAPGTTGPKEYDALDASTGGSLWSSGALPTGITGPGVTYTAGGKQYVEVLAGNSIYAFSL